MSVDAYYTSPIGIADVGFQGNRVLGAYETPREAVEFVDRKGERAGPLNARRARVSRQRTPNVDRASDLRAV